MNVLIIKTSSLGDIIHTFPALTDAALHDPNIQFDWVVEESFAEVPTWHPRVRKVIPVALRRWRRQILKTIGEGEPKHFLQNIRAEKYNHIIDAQGLLKSAILGLCGQGLRSGFGWHSSREKISGLFYQQRFEVDRTKHAVDRVRHLFAQILGYSTSHNLVNYGISRSQFPLTHIADNVLLPASSEYLVFLHGTTWPTKLWPESFWQALIEKVSTTTQFKILLLWGNTEERERGERLAAFSDQVQLLPRINLQTVAAVISGARGIVSVDTGIAHLAAALSIPTVSIYGPTNPALTGTIGQNQVHMSANFACAPCLSRQCTYPEKTSLSPACFNTVHPDNVFTQLLSLINTI